MHKQRFVIIGAGIVGLATALRLQQRRPHAEITIFEKEAGPATHQSGHNSGVIHAGVYYAPGSLKARLCRLGLVQTAEFCERYGVPYRTCGKLVVATSDIEVARLKKLLDTATSNGVRCRWIDASALRELEPNVRGLAALHVTETGIVDYAAVCASIDERVREHGANLKYGEAVESIAEHSQGVVLETTKRRHSADHLIVCAGLQSDRLAAMAGLELDFTIVPFRGDFYRLTERRSSIVRHLIYPVADPALPFLGVHLTATIDGGMTVGPSAMLAFAREIYRKRAVNLRDARELVCSPALWRLLARYPRAGLRECLHAASRTAYLRAVQRYCPDIVDEDLGEYHCGIRAQAVDRRGALIHDFLVKQTPNSTHICNAPSPAATAALPIADSIIDGLPE